MTTHFLIYIFIPIFYFNSHAQSKDALQKYIANTLSYQHINGSLSDKDSRINIYQIEFKDCTMSYPLFIKKGDKTERFTIRILLSGIKELTMTKTKEGYYAIHFATTGKSILKEYPDGVLVHEKKQIIPLKKYDPKALEYFKKLRENCIKNKH